MPDENDIVYNTYGIDIRPFVEKVLHFFGYGDDPLAGPTINDVITSLFHFWNVYSVIALILSLLFFAGFIYARMRYEQLAEIEREQIEGEERAWAEKYGGTAREHNQWDDIKQHVSSDNPNDWKQAIIEADILLQEVLDASGYVGNTIGDMLKSASAHPFSTIQDAWDAHLVRNKIAHQGSDFVLTKRMAQDTIVQFERVFREFGAI